MEKHRLILHIGTPKTGTSALQKFLYDNREELIHNGFCYPDLVAEMEQRRVRVWADEDERYKNGLVLNAYIDAKRRNIIDISRNNGGWSVLWEILKEMLQYSDVIVSEESIWWWDTKAVLEAMKKEYDNICIVVYLRRQDRYIESDWNQRVKRYGYCSDTFTEDIIKRKNNPIFKYVEKLEEIEYVCGINNMIVRVYEKSQFDGERADIVSDFLKSIGCNISWENCIETKVVNQSLVGNLLEIKRIMNSVLMKGDYASQNVENAFLSYLNSSVKSSNKNIRSVESYYTDEQRKDVVDRYRNDNEIIARKYLNQDEGRLFCEELKSNETIEPDSNMYEDIIKIFTQIALEQETRMYRQRVEMHSMFRYELLNMIIKHDGREVMAFGGGAMCEHILRKYDIPVMCVVDNNKELKGTSVSGRKVVHPNDILEWEKYIILICCRDTKEIQIQLEQYGLKKDRDFMLATEYLG